MKKILSIFVAILTLAPAAAFAGSVSWDAATVNVGDDATFSAVVDGGDAIVIYRSDGCSIVACNDRNYIGGSTHTNSSFEADYGGGTQVPSAYNGGTGVMTIAYISPYNGSSAVDCNTLANCISNGWVVTQSSITVQDAPAPPSAPGLGQIIDNSTSSVEQVTGFGMNSMALWSWVNIGKPALGMGLGTLYTLRWYIMSIIALAIIAFFGFRYFGFFKH